MKRREFLKKTAAGSAALAAAPLVVHGLATPAMAGNRTNFDFVSVARQVGGTDIIILSGAGAFNRAQVVGDGSFTHFSPGGAPPFLVIGSGTWKAKRLVSFTSPGTYGAHASGTLEMLAHLLPASGGVIAATMVVNCNIPPAGLFTGLSEGVSLMLEDGSTFEPAPDLTAATLFSTGVEARDSG